MQVASGSPSFAWTDGSDFDHTRWRPNCPRAFNRSNCAAIVFQEGYMCDSTCDSTHFQLCQKSKSALDDDDIFYDFRYPRHNVSGLTRNQMSIKNEVEELSKNVSNVSDGLNLKIDQILSKQMSNLTHVDAISEKLENQQSKVTQLFELNKAKFVETEKIIEKFLFIKNSLEQKYEELSLKIEDQRKEQQMIVQKVDELSRKMRETKNTTSSLLKSYSSNMKKLEEFAVDTKHLFTDKTRELTTEVSEFSKRQNVFYHKMNEIRENHLNNVLKMFANHSKKIEQIDKFTNFTSKQHETFEAKLAFIGDKIESLIDDQNRVSARINGLENKLEEHKNNTGSLLEAHSLRIAKINELINEIQDTLLNQIENESEKSKHQVKEQILRQMAQHFEENQNDASETLRSLHIRINENSKHMKSIAISLVVLFTCSLLINLLLILIIYKRKRSGRHEVNEVKVFHYKKDEKQKDFCCDVSLL
ncbi:hypothetical protein B4U79_17492 [Dinothrombium tinctorium]|uniref:C-type lectin domain-containing protein n=1 Tax=Dinothrombium tinctorium TaxID=1965070 RepID=A0A3S3P134_9ACAR|nr:hypothetical protein B4U79_16583 [Dinothrombium tinctorium]RWS11925.1 hypothetical protein B4U79_17495 [Dinothrombium tinctorium]RWS11972.1 hypothetical protein B4U79_17492 [Dinothrombium tinctorium]